MGTYKILKIYNRMINKTWKHNLSSTQLRMFTIHM